MKAETAVTVYLHNLDKSGTIVFKACNSYGETLISGVSEFFKFNSRSHTFSTFVYEISHVRELVFDF